MIELSTIEAEPIELERMQTVLMDADEARACITRIKTRIDVMRGELLELKEREGWRALGYRSWGACARAEFGDSAATLYRQLEAAEIERDVRKDSQLENLPPIPTAQLQAVKELPPAQRSEAFKRADELAGDQPRTAKHIAQAADEIARPDLPPDFSIVQRRLAAHGVALSTHPHGSGLAFVTRKEGMTGIVTPTWSNVIDRLERLEDQAEHDSEHPEQVSDRQAHLAHEARDAGHLERARSLIAAHAYADARAELDQVSDMSACIRDQLRATIPIGQRITFDLSDDDCAALLREAHTFEHAGLTKKLPTIGQALVLIVEAIKGAA